MADTTPTPVIPFNPIPIPNGGMKLDIQSKTWWLNLGTILLNAAFAYIVYGKVTASGAMEASDPNGIVVGNLTLATFMKLFYTAMASPAVIAFLNIILRYKTEKPVVSIFSMAGKVISLAQQLANQPAAVLPQPAPVAPVAPAVPVAPVAPVPVTPVQPAAPPALILPESATSQPTQP